MSMYAVNTSIPKTLVRHLVRYYADTCGDDRLSEILLDILDTPDKPGAASAKRRQDRTENRRSGGTV